jgi:hypothetical protein
MKDFNGFRKYVFPRQMKLYGNLWKGKNKKYVSKADRLIDGIYSGEFLNDKEAAWALYKESENHKSYQMLKSRVKEQLIGFTFQIDPSVLIPKITHSYNVFLANRYYSAGQILMSIGLGAEGDNLLKECLSISKKHQLHGHIINASRLLKSRVGYMGTKTEYKMYDENIKQSLDIYKAEIESDDMRDKMNISMRATFSPQDKKGLSLYWKRINFLCNKYNTQILRINRIRIGYFYFEAITDFKSIIRMCDEMINFMLTHKYFYELPRHRDLLFMKLDAFIRMEDFENGQIIAESAIKLHSNYNFNSLLIFEYYILLCLYSRKYKKAFELVTSATNMQIYQELPYERKEKWKLFEAYLSFVYPESGLKVKPAVLFSEMPVFSKDKGGISITIVIAQIVILLDEGNFDKLLDRSDAFKIYFKRYVNRQIHYRTYLFTKMIETLFRCNFNYGKVEEAAKEFRLHLRDKKGFYKGRIEALEIIPYEVLWEQILLRLKKHEPDFVKVQGIKIKQKPKKQVYV